MYSSENTKGELFGRGSTLADMRELYIDAGLGKSLAYLLSPDRCTRLSALESILEDVYSELVVNRHLICLESEDQISSRVVGMLKMAGVNASHDTQWGGHVDIAVVGPSGFYWMAEAKIDSGNSWLLKGYRQLATRYLPGQRGANVGGILVYGKKRNALKTIKKWAASVESMSGTKILEDRCDVELWFRSSQVSNSSGLPIYIRHRILSLYFKPED